MQVSWRTDSIWKNSSTKQLHTADAEGSGEHWYDLVVNLRLNVHTNIPCAAIPDTACGPSLCSRGACAQVPLGTGHAPRRGLHCARHCRVRVIAILYFHSCIGTTSLVPGNPSLCSNAHRTNDSAHKDEYNVYWRCAIGVVLLCGIRHEFSFVATA